jgi:hypothetical protein
VRNTGSRKGDEFICVPIGIRDDGLEVEARQALEFTAYDPLTGKALKSATMQPEESLTLPRGPGALIIVGRTPPMGEANRGPASAEVAADPFKVVNVHPPDGDREVPISASINLRLSMPVDAETLPNLTLHRIAGEKPAAVPLGRATDLTNASITLAPRDFLEPSAGPSSSLRALLSRPIRGEAGRTSSETQSFHKYRYTHGDPVSYADPTGLFEGLIGALGSIGVGNSVRSHDASASANTALTAYRFKRTVQVFQKTLQIFHKVLDGLQTIVDIIDLLNFDPSDIIKIKNQLVGLGLNAGLDALPDRVVKKEFKLPGKLVKKLNKVFSKISN